MTRFGEDGPRPGFEQRVVAASVAQAFRHRAAHHELGLINRELAAEAARLAAMIERRLIPRRIA